MASVIVSRYVRFMPTPLERLWARHDVALDRLSKRQQLALVRVLRESRAEILQSLAAAGPVDRLRLQATLLRLNPLFVRLSQRLGLALEAAEADTLDLGLAHALQLWRNRADPTAALIAETEVRMAGRLAQYRSLGLYQPQAQGLSTVTAQNVQRELVAGVLQRETEAQLAARIERAAFMPRARAALVARMETNRAYNAVANEMAEERGWRRRIVETLDARNHPFSRAANGKEAAPGRLFQVPVAEVNAAANSMGRKVGTILWRRAGANYVGDTLPAHFNERGRIVPWNPNWPSDEPT